MLKISDDFKDKIERMKKNHKYDEDFLNECVKGTIGFVKFFTILKIFIAILLIILWFLNFPFLQEIIIVAVVISLIVPNNVHSVFIEKNLEYTATTIENRNLLNATEANAYLDAIDKKLEKLELEINELK